MTEKTGPVRVRVTVSNRTILRVLGIILVTYLFLKLVIRVDHILELIFVSFFLCLALNPAVSWIAKSLRVKSRIAATGIAYLVVVVVLVAFFALVLPPLIRQSITFAEKLPSDVTSLQKPNTESGRIIQHYNLKPVIRNLSQEIKAHTKNLQGPAISTATRVGNILLSTVIVFVLTFMMLVEGPSLLQKYWQLKFGRVEWHQELAERMYRIVSGYVNGQLLLALIGGAVSLVALLITSNLLHVSINSVALAGIIVFTGLIPMIGHIIGGVLVVVSCLFVSWPLALIMAIVLIVYMELESITLQPYIQAKYNELTPLLVFIAALIGVSAAGLLGAFIAIPVAGCLKVIVKEVLVHKKIVKA